MGSTRQISTPNFGYLYLSLVLFSSYSRTSVSGLLPAYVLKHKFQSCRASDWRTCEGGIKVYILFRNWWLYDTSWKMLLNVELRSCDITVSASRHHNTAKHGFTEGWASAGLDLWDGRQLTWAPEPTALAGLQSCYKCYIFAIALMRLQTDIAFIIFDHSNWTGAKYFFTRFPP